MRILIAGAGIGGLAAAVGLRRAGFDPRIFERAGDLRAAGAGLTIWSNATLALRRLGLEDALRRISHPLTTLRTLDARGRVLAEDSTGWLGERMGASGAALHRADLQRELIQAVGADRIVLGREAAGYRSGSGGVALRFADGREEEGDVLVGADGIRSALRRRLLGSSEARPSGVYAWRGVTETGPAWIPDGIWQLFLGREGEFGLIPVTKGRVYWFGAAKGGGGGGPEARERFGRWAEPIPSLLRATADADVIGDALADHAPAARWGEGRMTLLGDAAHATTPHLGQGACQALEDAVVLVRCLKDAAAPEAGLRRYEELRRPRAERIVAESRRMGDLIHAEPGPLAWMRDRMIRWMPRAWRRSRIESFVRVELPELT